MKYKNQSTWMHNELLTSLRHILEIHRFKMAVREGVEPSIPCGIHTFQACSFGHSDTSPYFTADSLRGSSHC